MPFGVSPVPQPGRQPEAVASGLVRDDALHRTPGRAGLTMQQLQQRFRIYIKLLEGWRLRPGTTAATSLLIGFSMTAISVLSCSRTVSVLLSQKLGYR